jgi:hypothetical protein
MIVVRMGGEGRRSQPSVSLPGCYGDAKKERPRLNRLLTLVIATAASVVAAIVASELFDGGVVATAAITPVIVALVTDLLSAVTPGRGDREAPQPAGSAAAETPPPRRRLGFGAIVAAILTGLAAFLIAVVALTVPEVVADKSITGDSAHTTFFGDNANKPWGEARSWSDCFDDIEQCVRDIVESNQ